MVYVRWHRSICSGSSVTPGFEPAAALQAIASRIGGLSEPAEIERALDEVAFLSEAADPELQYLAAGLVDALRRRLAEIPRQA